MSTPTITDSPEAVAAGSSPATGSDAAYDDPLRQKVIRIVLQMSDTPTNRLTMLKAHAAIKAIRAGIEGHAVLKREEIIIACLEVPSPQPNVEMTDANRERTKP